MLTLTLESHLRAVEVIYYLIVDYRLIQLLWVSVIKRADDEITIAHFFGFKFQNLNWVSAGNSCYFSCQIQSSQYCCLFGYFEMSTHVSGLFDLKIDVLVYFVFSLLWSLNCAIFECLKTSSYSKSILICYFGEAFLWNWSLAQTGSAMFGVVIQTTTPRLAVLCGS